MIIKRISPLSAAKIAGLICAVMGFPLALVLWVISFVGLNSYGLTNSPFGLSAGLMAGAGAAAVVTLPIVNGAFGFVMTLFAAWLYNLMTGLVGGLRVDVQTEP